MSAFELSLPTVIIILMLGVSGPRPSIAEEAEAWGSRPYEVEKPLFDERVADLEKEINELKLKRDQSHRELEATIGPDDPEARREFEAWYEENGNWPPVLPGQIEDAEETLEDARRRLQLYENAGLPSADHPVLGSDVRGSLWRARIAELEAQSSFLDLCAWDAKFQATAVKRYVYDEDREWIESRMIQLLNVTRAYGESFFADLLDCFTRGLIQGGAASLAAWQATLRGQGSPQWLEQTRLPGYGQDSVLTDRGMKFNCLSDAVRNGIVNAAVLGMRHNFVREVSESWNVPEPIAHYWWAEMIHIGDKPDSPWAPHYRGLFDRVVQSGINAYRRSTKNKNLAEHAKDGIKFSWQQGFRGRLAQQLRMDALNQLTELRRSNPGMSRPDMYKQVVGDLKVKAIEAVQSDTHAKFVEGFPWLAMGVQSTFKQIYLNSKMDEFRAAAKPIVDEYRRIVACLEKQEMASGPAQVIAVYDMPSRHAVEAFFASCEDETRAQKIARGQGVYRELYLELENAREAFATDNARCEAALAQAESELESHAGAGTFEEQGQALGQLIVAMQEGAEAAEEECRSVGISTVNAEQSALRVCEAMKTNLLESSAELVDAASFDIRASASVTREQHAQALESLRIVERFAAVSKDLHEQLTVGADSLAIRLKAMSSQESGEGPIAEAKADLAASRESALPQLHKRADRAFERLVAELTGVDDPTADRLLDEGLVWLIEIRRFNDVLTLCQERAGAAVHAVSPIDGEGGADEALADIDSLRQNAGVALAQVNDTLDLARSYALAAQSALDHARLCEELADTSRLRQADGSRETIPSPTEGGGFAEIGQQDTSAEDGDGESQEMMRLKAEADEIRRRRQAGDDRYRFSVQDISDEVEGYVAELQRQQLEDTADARREMLDIANTMIQELASQTLDIGVETQTPQAPAQEPFTPPNNPSWNPVEGWGAGTTVDDTVVCASDDNDRRKACSRVGDYIHWYEAQANKPSGLDWDSRIQRSYLYRAQCCGYRWTTENETSASSTSQPDESEPDTQGAVSEAECEQRFCSICGDSVVIFDEAVDPACQDCLDRNRNKIEACQRGN